MSQLSSKEGVERETNSLNSATHEHGEENSSTGKSIFSMMKKSANVTSRRSSRRKSGPNSKKGTPSQETNQAPRRVVKAVPPPLSSGEDRNPPATSNDGNVVDDVLPGRETKRVPLPGGTVGAEQEMQRERGEKWRHQRLEAGAAARKEHKEKDIDQKRRQKMPSAPDDQSDLKKEKVDTPVPEIFSVSPKFPEHKRTVDLLGQPHRKEEPFEKKHKVGPSTGDEGAGNGEAATERSIPYEENVVFPGWLLKVAVPAVAVAAVAALVAMQAIRRK